MRILVFYNAVAIGGGGGRGGGSVSGAESSIVKNKYFFKIDVFRHIWPDLIKMLNQRWLYNTTIHP